MSLSPDRCPGLCQEKRPCDPRLTPGTHKAGHDIVMFTMMSLGSAATCYSSVCFWRTSKATWFTFLSACGHIPSLPPVGALGGSTVSVVRVGFHLIMDIIIIVFVSLGHLNQTCYNIPSLKAAGGMCLPPNTTKHAEYTSWQGFITRNNSYEFNATLLTTPGRTVVCSSSPPRSTDTNTMYLKRRRKKSKTNLLLTNNKYINMKKKTSLKRS